jgi:hypothetical protein
MGIQVQRELMRARRPLTPVERHAAGVQSLSDNQRHICLGVMPIDQVILQPQ